MSASVPDMHVVRSPGGCNATSPRYVGPLLGNGELSLTLDESGLMHNFAAPRGWPSPRIYWAGRRLNTHLRPMVPFGLVWANQSWDWLESLDWSQALDVKAGLVTTEHRRRADVLDRTETLLMLDRNLLAVRKTLHGQREGQRLELHYRLCPPREGHPPEGIGLVGGGNDDSAAWLDYTLDGVVRHVGRVALWADRPSSAVCSGNELRLTVPLAAGEDQVIVFLAFADDLGDEMFYRHTGWSGRHGDHPMLADVVHDLHARKVTRSDPVADVAELRCWTGEVGWPGVADQQARLWGEFWNTGWVQLDDDPDAQAIWETGMYATRCQLTRWSVPVLIHGEAFNGQYFHDEMSAARALLLAGHWPLVRRIVEHKLSVLPLAMQCMDGVGANGSAASYEGGYFAISPTGTSLHEVHAAAEPARAAWSWLLFAGAGEADLKRYYPLLWGAAEFFRRWMVYLGPDGNWFTGRCIDFNESIRAVINGAATVSAAAVSMDLAARVAEKLGVDGDIIPEWRKIAENLARQPHVNSRGMLCQYEGDEGVSFTTLQLVSDPPFNPAPVPPEDPRVGKLLDAALAECKLPENWACAASHDPDLAYRAYGDVRFAHPMAWTWLAARAMHATTARGEGRRSAEILQELIRCRLNFGHLYELKVLDDGFISLPLFLTSNSELSGSIASMLIRPADDRIDLLPAVPEEWRSFSFRLAAYNRTIVTLAVVDNELTRLEVAGPQADHRVRIPKRFGASKLLGPALAEVGGCEEFVIPSTKA